MSSYSHHPHPNIPCVRCNKNHDTPAAFLMVCAKCERAWHHTCHIPQVSEEEIMERISFDKQGKRDAGLAGWHCKRCTKRARLEPPPSVVASASTQHQFKPSLNRYSNAPARTTSSVPSQAHDPAPIHIVISDDEDDIVILDDAPQQSQQSIADPKNKAQDICAPKGTQQAVDQGLHTPSKSPLPQPPQPAPVVGMDSLVKATKTIKLSNTAQKRPAKSQLIITPLPTLREPPTGAQEPGPSTQPEPDHIPRPSPPPPPPPPEPEDHPSRTRSLAPIRPPQPIQPEPTIQHITFPEPPAANMKTISTADIRALISTMRSDGRLAPPPEVEYVHTRPARHDGDRTSKPAPRRSGARKLAYTPGRTLSPELDEVERKLEDFDGDEAEVEMDVDRRSDPDAMREEDEEEDGPHNIDDLYGDVAPRYRRQPSRRFKSRSKTAPAPAAAPRPPPPAEMRLLFAERAKRQPKVDDLGLLLDKKLRLEGRPDSRAPRKTTVTERLKGKALMRKQVSGFYFSIHEERKRIAGD